MRFPKTPIDELVGGTFWEAKSFLRQCEEGLTPEATAHMVEEQACATLRYEIDRHGVSQDNPLVWWLLNNYDPRLADVESPYELRWQMLPHVPPFSTMQGWPRVLGHVMAKVVDGVKGDMRERDIPVSAGLKRPQAGTLGDYTLLPLEGPVDAPGAVRDPS